jgi:hypothetical protein
MKQCSTCKEFKLLSEFHKDDYQEDGHNHRCSECMSKYIASKNPERMYLNGKYISKKHPLYKPGRYKSLDDAWSHQEIERTKEGEVYIVYNTAFPHWFKVGKAVSSEDRLNGYQTASPFRDYVLEYYEHFENRHQAESAIHRLLEKHPECMERRGEWFKTFIPTIKEVMNDYRQQSAEADDIGHRDKQSTQYDLVGSNARC